MCVFLTLNPAVLTRGSIVGNCKKMGVNFFVSALLVIARLPAPKRHGVFHHNNQPGQKGKGGQTGELFCLFYSPAPPTNTSSVCFISAQAVMSSASNNARRPRAWPPRRGRVVPPSHGGRGRASHQKHDRGRGRGRGVLRHNNQPGQEGRRGERTGELFCLFSLPTPPTHTLSIYLISLKAGGVGRRPGRRQRRTTRGDHGLVRCASFSQGAGGGGGGRTDHQNRSRGRGGRG